MTFLKLVRFELERRLTLVLILADAAFAAPTAAVYGYIKTGGVINRYVKFEDAFTGGGGPIYFYVLLAILVFIIIRAVYADFVDSKSIYTLLSLPVKRQNLFFAKLLAFYAWLVMLLAATYSGTIFSYSVFRMIVNSALSYTPGGYSFRNGFLLALIRLPFFKLVMPISPQGCLLSVTLAVTLVCSVFFLALCERARDRLFIPYIIAYGYSAVVVTSGILNQNQYNTAFFIFAAGHAALSVLAICYGLRLVKRAYIV